MSKDYNKIKYDLLKDYFLGKTSEEESRLIADWLSKEKSEANTDKLLRMLWRDIEPTGEDFQFDEKRVLDSIHHKINLRSKHHFQKKPRYSAGKIFSNLSKVAAIVLLPLSCYLTWKICNQSQHIHQKEEVVYNEIICPLGAITHFELPDGTTGSLNNGSRLKYPARFYGDSRKVELQGEAFFNVVEDKDNPFIVETTNLDVKVLGTCLNVLSYPDDNYQEFTLINGTIELYKRTDETSKEPVARMKPGQHATYTLKGAPSTVGICRNKIKQAGDIKQLQATIETMDQNEQVAYELDGGSLVFKYENVARFISWKDGMLVLRNDPMPMLLRRIERWYHVRFNVLDERINQYTYWATFEQENIDQVLNLLSLTAPIEFKKRPREIEEGIYKPQVIDVKLRN